MALLMLTPGDGGPQVPVLAVPCALGRAPTDSTGGPEGWWGSVVPAVWSYMLAARARGLGTVYTTLHLPYRNEVGEALGIPDTVTQLACIPTAYYTGDTFKTGARRPAEGGRPFRPADRSRYSRCL